MILMTSSSNCSTTNNRGPSIKYACSKSGGVDRKVCKSVQGEVGFNKQHMHTHVIFNRLVLLKHPNELKLSIQ